MITRKGNVKRFMQPMSMSAKRENEREKFEGFQDAEAVQRYHGHIFIYSTDCFKR